MVFEEKNVTSCKDLNILQVESTIAFFEAGLRGKKCVLTAERYSLRDPSPVSAAHPPCRPQKLESPVAGVSGDGPGLYRRSGKLNRTVSRRTRETTPETWNNAKIFSSQTELKEMKSLGLSAYGKHCLIVYCFWLDWNKWLMLKELNVSCLLRCEH